MARIKRKQDSPFSDEVIDSLLKSADPKELLSEGGLLSQLAGRLIERALEGEMTHHLGYEPHDPDGRGSGNSRNGNGSKTIKTGFGESEISTPRDRDGSFTPELVKKRQTRIKGLDDKILGLYSRGMTVRDIQGHLEELYSITVSPDLISRATSAVWEDVQAWQNRPLDPLYAIVYLDALVIKAKDEGVVRNKSVYIALGVSATGTKEVLGLWMDRTEGAKFWLKILNELKMRGVEDMLVVCCDGLKGFPEAIEAAFPKSVVQTCIVHMIRNSLRFVSYKDRKAVAKALKPIYTAVNREAAEQELATFREQWDSQYPMIAESWSANWERVVPFLDFPQAIRKVIYTTNAIEAVNSSLRKLIKNRGHFPSDEAVIKLLYLALGRFEKKWTKSLRDWGTILGQFAIFFPGRIPTI